MGVFVEHTGAGGPANLESTTPSIGDAFVKHPNRITGQLYVTSAGTIRAGIENVSNLYYCPTAPATAEYDLEVEVVHKSNTTGAFAYLFGRLQTTGETGYRVDLFPGFGIALYRTNNGTTAATLGSNNTSGVTAVTVVNNPHVVRLSITDAEKSVWLNGTKIISSADNTLTTAGYGGLFIRAGGGLGGDSVGTHIEYFKATQADQINLRAIMHHRRMQGMS